MKIDFNFLKDILTGIENDDRLRLTNKGHDLLVSLKDNKIMREITRSGRKIALESVIGIASALGANVLTKIIES